jgi:putative transcriptional regulator
VILNSCKLAGTGYVLYLSLVAFDHHHLMAKQQKRYNRIKIVLIEKEKTNLWLAEQLGVSRGTVSKWCTNDNQPNVETLFRIADLLNVEVPELLNLKQPRQNASA